jgi:hypothetical protein
MAPIQAKNFSMGNVTLDPNGGQVAVAQPGAGGDLFRRRSTGKCASAKNGAR